MADILISNSENINNIQLKDQSVAPTTPNSGFKRLYVKSGGLYYIDSTGTEHGVMEIADLSTITLTAGIGLSGGGTIAANRTFDLDLNDLTTEASPASGDFIPIVDISESNALNKATIASILALASSAGLKGFAAYDAADQTVTTSVLTKITFTTEVYDSDGWFSASRFTPLSAGKYFVYFRVGATQLLQSEIQKNGANIARSGQFPYFSTIVSIVDMNGTTDYLEAYASDRVGTNIAKSNRQAEFGAFLIA